MLKVVFHLVDGVISLRKHIIQARLVVYFTSLVQHQQMTLDWYEERTLYGRERETISQN